MSDTEPEGTGTSGGAVEASEAVVTDENGRIRFRTLRVNKGAASATTAAAPLKANWRLNRFGFVPVTRLWNGDRNHRCSSDVDDPAEETGEDR